MIELNESEVRGIVENVESLSRETSMRDVSLAEMCLASVLRSLGIDPATNELRRELVAIMESW